MERKERIGILTAGGDCPGLNAAIRAATKTALQSGYEVIGILNGWKGLLENETKILDRVNTSGIIDKGGTILGTSRLSPLKIENGPQKVLDNFAKLGLKALIVMGGEGTLSIAYRLSQMGLPLVGIPKTIDNDVRETDFTIGFQTAVQIATDALDRLRSTAESHHRVMLLEVMGRYTGWIATFAGMANGADAIIIPEIPLDSARMEKLCQMLVSRKQRGINFSVVVAAEGAKIDDKHILRPTPDVATGEQPLLGGVGSVLGRIIAEKTGLDIRVTSLGYVQRGGTPVAYDRSLATAFGVRAVELINKNKYGEMTALKGNRIVSVPLEKVADGIKTVNLSVYRIAERFFG